jgi:hypothetical protein
MSKLTNFFIHIPPAKIIFFVIKIPLSETTFMLLLFLSASYLRNFVLNKVFEFSYFSLNYKLAAIYFSGNIAPAVFSWIPVKSYGTVIFHLFFIYFGDNYSISRLFSVAHFIIYLIKFEFFSAIFIIPHYSYSYYPYSFSISYNIF